MIYAISAYLVLWLIGLSCALLSIINGLLPYWMDHWRMILICMIMGGVGGCVYCLRGVYLNKCVKKNWDKEWYVWYFLRPVISTVCGAVSYIFLQAGLFIFESAVKPDSTFIGFYACAFIAGLNVDRFITKTETIAQANREDNSNNFGY